MKQRSPDLANSISKQITIDFNRNKSIVIYNLDYDDVLNTLLNDLDLSQSVISKQKLNTNNIGAYTINLRDNIPTNIIINNFYKLDNRSSEYHNIFIRPDLSYKDRARRLILNIGYKSISYMGYNPTNAYLILIHYNMN